MGDKEKCRGVQRVERIEMIRDADRPIERATQITHITMPMGDLSKRTNNTQSKVKDRRCTQRKIAKRKIPAEVINQKI
jgi:hypothetical protein